MDKRVFKELLNIQVFDCLIILLILTITPSSAGNKNDVYVSTEWTNNIKAPHLW